MDIMPTLVHALVGLIDHLLLQMARRGARANANSIKSSENFGGSKELGIVR